MGGLRVALQQPQKSVSGQIESLQLAVVADQLGDDLPLDPNASFFLQRLLADRDPRVAMLAHTQLWRTRTATVTLEDLQGWETWLQRMPGDLRAGPYCVIGQAWSSKGSPAKSALSYLRVPILYPADRRLAAAALLSAGRELEKIGQVQQAVTLYREVVRDYAAAPAAAEARGRLEELSL